MNAWDKFKLRPMVQQILHDFEDRNHDVAINAANMFSIMSKQGE